MGSNGVPLYKGRYLRRLPLYKGHYIRWLPLYCRPTIRRLPLYKGGYIKRPPLYVHIYMCVCVFYHIGHNELAGSSRNKASELVHGSRDDQGPSPNSRGGAPRYRQLQSSSSWFRQQFIFLCRAVVESGFFSDRGLDF